MEKPWGRPRISDEKRAEGWLVVAAAWCAQGLGSGERTLLRVLGREVPRTIVRESLKSLKLDLRRRTRERLEASRQRIEVFHRDAVWSLDAQELARGVDLGVQDVPGAPLNPSEARGPEGKEGNRGAPAASKSCRKPRSRKAGIVQAEMVRDVASTKTVEAAVGPPANADEVIAVLERAAADRGTLPHVLVTDNGGPYRWRNSRTGWGTTRSSICSTSRTRRSTTRGSSVETASTKRR